MLLLKFVKFSLVGFSGVFVDFGITYIFKEKFSVNKYISNSLGFICAATSNYFLNRIWTFQSHDPAILLQYSKFFTISLIGLMLNNLVVFFIHQKGQINFYVSKIFAIALVTLWNFFANYLYTFSDAI